MAEWKLTDRFNCADDAGRNYLVIEMTEQVRFNGVWESSVADGGKKFHLLEGQRVNQIDDNSFQIVDNEKIIRKA